MTKKILIITIPLTVLILAFVAVAPPVFAGHCTTTVTAPDSIQDAVDSASSGDVICLDGTFTQSVLFGPEDSDLTLSEEVGDAGVLDGFGTTGVCTAGFTICRFNVDWGILLTDGVTKVTIENLEIKNYDDGLGGGGQGNAIQAFAEISTSDITVRNNYMHGNQWNGVLVGSEGTTSHNSWKVYHNTVNDNGFVGIELTNCNDCEITNNMVDDSGFADIVVQARNTSTGSGSLTIENVLIEGNILGNSVQGIRALSFTGDRNDFSVITGATSILKSVKIIGNTITDSSSVQIKFDAFNSAATIELSDIKDNEINCDPADSATGIEFKEGGISATERGDLNNAKLQDNTIDLECDPDLIYQGNTSQLSISD